jgi:plasmid stability protein
MSYAGSVSKIIQIRNVPDALDRQLKARAAWRGMSVSDYLLMGIQETLESPTLAEMRERLHQRERVSAQFDSAGMVRNGRDATR